MGVPVSGSTPSLDNVPNRDEVERALYYMGLEENQPITSIEIDHVFIGSCTNSSVNDLKNAVNFIKGKNVKYSVRACVVLGSIIVKLEDEYIWFFKCV